MRISDWSSDVCSSDLQGGNAQRSGQALARSNGRECRPDSRWLGQHRRSGLGAFPPYAGRSQRPQEDLGRTLEAGERAGSVQSRPSDLNEAHAEPPDGLGWPGSKMYHRPSRRSEEQTSELQSLMRISYAVFCLTTTREYTTYTQHT